MKMDYLFVLEFQVRDYECDMQGIVNNSVYQGYLEHTRHEYLKSVGVDFGALAKKKINLVVTRVEMEYRSPLKSGNTFFVGLTLQRVSRVRFCFIQDIYRLPDRKLSLHAKVTGTALNENGRPGLPEELTAVLEDLSPS